MRKTRKKNLSGANNSMSMTPELAECIKKIGAEVNLKINPKLLQAETERKNLTMQHAYIIEVTTKFVKTLLEGGIRPEVIEPAVGKIWMTFIKARCKGIVPDAAVEAEKCFKKMIIGMIIEDLTSDENKLIR